MKTILVTDPCYIISNKAWDNICNSMPEKWDYDKFSRLVEEKLREISGDENAVAGNTGFGDWTNIIGDGEFAADSGMVCVVDDSERLREYMSENGQSFGFGCCAELKVPDDSKGRIEENDTWSIVEIWSDGKVIEQSLPEMSQAEIDDKVWAEIDRRENELGRELTVEETEEVWREIEEQL